ncbi:uncharacterized protein LOC116776805 [Danaus plexippus]|uniref:uncharacterized protein LOC116776805 n=1 Tax=Danaus plexippus TaxID=13037 RepID=UPI002AB2B842|nr:uncharacterized protein LOC116776805 [Danaus plexippus]
MDSNHFDPAQFSAYMKRKFPELVLGYISDSLVPTNASDMECSSASSSASLASSEAGSRPHSDMEDDGFTTVISKSKRKRSSKGSSTASPRATSPHASTTATNPNVPTAPAASRPESPSGNKGTPAPASPVAKRPKPAAIPSPTPAGNPSPAPAENPSVAPDTPPRTTAPPPLYIRENNKWDQLSQIFIEKKIHFTSARPTNMGIKVQVSTAVDHRRMTALLRERGTEYHTYALEEERRLTVVIRGMPCEIPTDSILSDLKSQGLPAQAVHRMYRPTNKRPFNMVLVHLDNTKEAKAIFNIRTVCYLSGLQVELPRGRGIPGQCHRCQCYGHSARFCNARPRCVKCLGDHGTTDCPRKTPMEDVPPSCVLCQQTGHPANYRGCPKAPRRAKRGGKKSSHQPKAPKASGAPPSAPQAPEAPQAPQAPTVNAWQRKKNLTVPTASETAQPSASAHANKQDSGVTNSLSCVSKYFGAFDPPELLVFANKLKACGNDPNARLSAFVEHAEMINAIYNLTKSS